MSGEKGVFGPGDKQHAMVFSDVYSRYLWVYFLETVTNFLSDAIGRPKARYVAIGIPRITHPSSEVEIATRGTFGQFNLFLTL